MMRKIAVILLCIVVIASQAYFLKYHRTQYIYNLAKYNCGKIIDFYQMIGLDLDSFTHNFPDDIHFIDQPLYMAIHYNDITAIKNLLAAGMDSTLTHPVLKTNIQDLILAKIFAGILPMQQAFSLPNIGNKIKEQYNKQTDTAILNKIQLLTIPPNLRNHPKGNIYTDGFNSSTILYNNNKLTIYRFSETLSFYPRHEVNDYLAYRYKNKIGLLKPHLKKVTHLNGQDPRIFTYNNNIYMVFAIPTPLLYKLQKGITSKYSTQILISKLHINSQNEISIDSTVQLQIPNPQIIEKNWSPLIYKNNLYFVYSTSPELVILKPDLDTGICTEIQRSKIRLQHPYNNIRGGTNFIPINERQFISFTHKTDNISPNSNISMHRRSYSMTPVILTVDDNEQFHLSHISDTPILSNVIPRNHDYYAQVIFPTGLYEENGEYKVTIGVNDQETYMLSLDKEKLLRDVLHLQR